MLKSLTSANHLASALRAQDEFSEAVRILRETLEVRRRVLGAEHPDKRMSVRDLANVFHKQLVASTLAWSAFGHSVRRYWKTFLPTVCVGLLVMWWRRRHV